MLCLRPPVILLGARARRIDSRRRRREVEGLPVAGRGREVVEDAVEVGIHGGDVGGGMGGAGAIKGIG